MYGIGGCAVAAACLFAACGCEDNSSLEDAEFRIEPAEVTLSTNGTVVVLEAIGGNPPFTWRVTDPSRGTLSGEGAIVTYTRNAVEGANVVEVTDSLTWTASATIFQVNPDPAEEGDAGTNGVAAAQP
jgi:hypothetical protein